MLLLIYWEHLTTMNKKLTDLLIRYKDVSHKIERLLVRAVCGKRPMFSS
uniref:Uncharacterized protein n=1 Tax=Lotus japonicus TaxID=34305 RepID=I3SCX0_LOTJA|nr:unknown [Lotus japonicus]